MGISMGKTINEIRKEFKEAREGNEQHTIKKEIKKMDYTIRKYVFEIYERTDMTFVGTQEEFEEAMKELCKDKRHEWHLSDIVKPSEYERNVARVRVMDKITGYNNHS